MIFQNIIDFFKRLFPASNPSVTNEEQLENALFVRNYEKTSEHNYTQIIASRLASTATSESDIIIKGASPRALFLNECIQPVEANLKVILSRVLGVGGVVLKPAIYRNKIITEILNQDRLIEVEQKGGILTKAGFISDCFVKDGREYKRIEFHTLDEDGLYTILNKAVLNEKEVPLSTVPRWAEIEPVYYIEGLTQMLFAFIKSPTDNRKSFSGIYGVPITYGNEKLMEKIAELKEELFLEFKNKRAFIGISDCLLNSDNELPPNGVYRKFHSEDLDLWAVYSPEFRGKEYIETIEFFKGELEKAIGVSHGILTKLETRNATATEIKRSTIDTFTLVDNIQEQTEFAIRQLIYAFDVIANVNNLTPKGDFEVDFDWSYGLLEDNKETFNQLMTGYEAGLIKREEMRGWLKNEDEETAVKNLPKMAELLTED